MELRVHDTYHIPLPQLRYQSHQIKRSVEAHGLDLSVYNTYYGVANADAIDIKNVSWLREGGSWKWHWEGLQYGMVDWRHLFRWDVCGGRFPRASEVRRGAPSLASIA